MAQLTRDELEQAWGATPFSDLPIDHRERIGLLVAGSHPPERWLSYGQDEARGRCLAQLPSRAWYEWHWSRGIDPDGRRERLDAGLRALVIERDGYVCQLCGGEVDPADVHIDHITPWSLGGRSTLDNLQVAHSTCNLRKGNRV